MVSREENKQKMYMPLRQHCCQHELLNWELKTDSKYLRRLRVVALNLLKLHLIYCTARYIFRATRAGIIPFSLPRLRVNHFCLRFVAGKRYILLKCITLLSIVHGI